MPYRYLFLSFVLIKSCSASFAAPLPVHLDTLAVIEKRKLIAAERNTTFGYYRATDSCANKGDSVSAGSSLLKTDPYYFFFLGQTPASIDSFLAHRFKLTVADREKYSTLFIQSYNSPRAESYVKFKAMYEEDAAAKRSAENCGDSLTCANAAKRIRRTDSTHGGYLYNYVQQNGWPSLENGALYANLLAIHDHPHYEYYAPLLKKAIINGYATLDVLELMIQSSIADDRYDFSYTYASFQELLKTHAYRRFDISAIFSNKLPSFLPRLEQSAKQLCPARIFYFYEGKNKDTFDALEKKTIAEWGQGGNGLTETNIANGSQGILPKLTLDLNNQTCLAKNSMHSGSGVSNVSYHPSENTAPRLILYIVQEK